MDEMARTSSAANNSTIIEMQRTACKPGLRIGARLVMGNSQYPSERAGSTTGPAVGSYILCNYDIANAEIEVSCAGP